MCPTKNKNTQCCGQEQCLDPLPCPKSPVKAMMGSPTPLRNGGSPRTPSWTTPKQTKEVGEETNFVVSIDIWLRASFCFYISILCLSVPVAKISCVFQNVIIRDVFIHFCWGTQKGGLWKSVKCQVVAKSNLQSQELTEPGNLGLDFETDDGLCIVSYLVAKLWVGWPEKQLSCRPQHSYHWKKFYILSQFAGQLCNYQIFHSGNRKPSASQFCQVISVVCSCEKLVVCSGRVWDTGAIARWNESATEKVQQFDHLVTVDETWFNFIDWLGKMMEHVWGQMALGIVYLSSCRYTDVYDIFWNVCIYMIIWYYMYIY